MALTLNQLAIFAAIAKHASITKAAAALRISQPSISLQMKRLEKEFAVKIYKRQGRGIELTAQGQDFLGHAEKILTQIDQLEKSFKRGDTAVGNESLVVGGSYSPSAILLPSLLHIFRKKYPDVSLQLRTRSKTRVMRLVLKFKIDIAVINGRPESPLLVAEPYRWEKFVIFVPADHSLAKNPKLELSDIVRFPVVIGSSGGKTSSLVATLKSLATQTGVRIALCCDTVSAVKEAVRRGVGLGVLYEDSLKNEINSGEFKTLKFPGSAAAGCFSYIIYHRNRPLSSAAEQFLALLRENKAHGKKAYNAPKGVEETFPTDSP
jgi:DNA-binding transcriptional LysR family regulator